MDFGKVVQSPYVWIGGAALGAFLLITGANKGGASSGGGSAAAINPAYSSMVVALNTEAMKEQTAQAAIAADITKTRYQYDTAKTLGLYSSLQHIEDTRATLSQGIAETNAGVIKAQIAAQTAVLVDQSNNMTRLGLAQQETNQTVITTNGQVTIAQTQAKAQKHAADMGALGSIVGTVGNVVKAFA